MFKHILALLVLSVIVVLAMPFITQLLHWDMVAYEWIADKLSLVFSGDQVGTWIKKLIALLTIPVLVGLVPALIFRLVKNHWYEYSMFIVWIMWVVQVTVLACYK